MNRETPVLPLLRMLRKLQILRRLALPATVAALLLAPGALRAQELYTFSVGALGGLGGSPDADPGDKLDNTGFQLNLGMVSDVRTHVVLRLGKLGLDSEERFGSLTGAELTYATIGGEYRSRQSYYESGLYLALGGYRLEGDRFGGAETDTSIGLALGATGEFPINRFASVLVEISAHYADLDEAQLFGMLHAGLGFHF